MRVSRHQFCARSRINQAPSKYAGHFVVDGLEASKS